MRHLYTFTAVALVVGLGLLQTAYAKDDTNVPPAKESSAIKNVVSDTAITTAIKTKFLADKNIAGLSIHIETINGTVTLSGEVPSSDMKDRAASIARATDGVKDVVSNLVMKEASAAKNMVSDSAITAAVKSKLLADSNTSAINISVETVNGKVTLSGEVTSADMKDRAVSIARGTDGVKDVASNLVVKNSKQ